MCGEIDYSNDDDSDENKNDVFVQGNTPKGDVVPHKLTKKNRGDPRAEQSVPPHLDQYGGKSSDVRNIGSKNHQHTHISQWNRNRPPKHAQKTGQHWGNDRSDHNNNGNFRPSNVRSPQSNNGNFCPDNVRNPNRLNDRTQQSNNGNFGRANDRSRQPRRGNRRRSNNVRNPNSNLSQSDWNEYLAAQTEDNLCQSQIMDKQSLLDRLEQQLRPLEAQKKQVIFAMKDIVRDYNHTVHYINGKITVRNTCLTKMGHLYGIRPVIIPVCNKCKD